MIGPFRGGRVNSVSGVPGQPNTFYFGSVGGGVWKTDQRRPHLAADLRFAADRVDRRRRRRAVERECRVCRHRRVRHAVADLAMATGCTSRLTPERPGRISASTTRARSRASPSIRRTRTSSSSRRSATPTAPIPIAASTARATAAPPGRRSCSRATTSAPSTSRSTRRTPRRSTRRSGTPVVRRGASIRRRTARAAGSTSPTDGGATWQPLDPRPADRGVGRIGIAVAPSNSTRVYAIVDAKEGGLFRSDDAGATFAKVSSDARIWGRGWYFGKVVVDPKNPDLVYVSNTGVYRSTRRRQDVRRAVQGLAGRRRLSPAVDRSRRRQPHDSRRRSGRGRSASKA